MPPRSRGFDGCWTCRLRKVKCDGGKPRCERCVRAEVECKGYGVVLSWSDVLTTEGNTLVAHSHSKGSDRSRETCFRRRRLDLVVFPPKQRYELYDALSRAVSLFEDVEPRLVDGKYVCGPFGVFKLGAEVQNIGTRRISRETKKKTLEPGKKGDMTIQKEHFTTLEVSESHSRGLIDHTPDLEAVLAAQSQRSTLSRIQTPLSPVDLKTSRLPLEKHVDRVLTRSESRLDSPSMQSSSSRTNIHESSIFSKTDNTFVHYKLLDSAKLTILAIKGPWYRFNEQGMYHILYPKFFVNDESDDWKPDVGCLSDFFTLERSGDVVILPSLADAVASMAACNMPFIRVVHPNCCWDKLVVCKIKELIFELVCDELPRASSWDAYLFNREAEEVSLETLLKNIRFCIMCMVFSIGRFRRSRQHKSVKNPVDSYFVNDDLRVSIELRKVATNYLNYHLDEYDHSRWAVSHSWYEYYFLLALLLQIHIDNSFGVFENYDLIYAVGEILVKNIDEGKEARCYGRSSLETYLCQVFSFNHLFYASTQSVNSINYSIPEQDQQQKYGDLKEDYDLTRSNDADDLESDDEANTPSNRYEISGAGEDQPLSFTVHFNQKEKQKIKNRSFQLVGRSEKRQRVSAGPITPNSNVPDPFVSLGLPESLVRVFQEVVQLTNDKRLFRLNRVTPRNYPRICAETKDKILSWNVHEHWNLHELDSGKFLSKFHEGLYYNVQCFHKALQVYFERLIEEVPPAQCQQLIIESFAATESLSNTNMALARAGGNVAFTSSFWPLLVCGSEIELPQSIKLRAQCEQMWKNAFFTDYNYWRSKQILFEIWNRQEMDSEHNGFMDLVREWGIVLNL